VTIPDAVLIQFELLRMSIIVLETCRRNKEFVHQVGKKDYYLQCSFLICAVISSRPCIVVGGCMQVYKVPHRLNYKHIGIFQNITSAMELCGSDTAYRSKIKFSHLHHLVFADAT